MTRYLLILVVSFTFALVGRADTVRTLDGRTLEGQIKLDANDSITIQQTVGSAVRVKLSDVLSASFSGTAVTATTRPTRTSVLEPIRGSWAAHNIGKTIPNGIRRTATKITMTAGLIGTGGDRNGPDVLPFFARPIKGDAELTVRLAEITNDRSTAGIMLRGGLEPDAAFVYVGVGGSSEINWQSLTKSYTRQEKGKRIGEPKRGYRLSPPVWLKLQRESDFVNVLSSPDGQTWTSITQERVKMPEDAFIGVVSATTPEEARGYLPKDAKPNEPPAGFVLPQATFDTLRLVESPAVTGTGLRGEYFNSRDYSGPAKLVRVDPVINLNWGTKSPGPDVQPDDFSVRWRGTIRAPVTGKYRLFLSGDDEAILFSGNQKIIANKGSAEINLRAGRPSPIRILFVEHKGDAIIKLEWESEKVPRQVVPTQYLSPPTTNDVESETDTGLRAEYFSDQNLKDLQQVRTDSEVNFNQDTSPVDPKLNSFSVRWAGTITPLESGKYTFYTFSDDGVRLWVDNKLLVDNWKLNPGVEDSGVIQLTADKPVPIRMESFNAMGGWAARLMWEGPDIDKQIVPSDRLQTPGEALDTRILTRDGSELTGITIESMNDIVVRLKRPDGEDVSMPTDRVARLSTRPLTTDMLSRAPSGSSGVLLTSGDFFEGIIDRIEGRRVTVNSLIFGQRSFNMRSEVAAVVLQDVRPDPADYVVRTTNGSTYMASELTVDAGKLSVTDRAAGKVVVPLESLRELTYFGPRVVPLASVVKGNLGNGVAVNSTPLGLPMAMHDLSPNNGYGVSSGASATFDLNGQYKTFLATTGVPAALLPTAGVVFIAEADGKVIYTSPAMTSISDSLPVSLKVEKAKSLTLKVEPADGSNGILLPGVWAEPMLTKP